MTKQIEIPEYPFWKASAAEGAFGADAAQYLDISKEEARGLCNRLPAETKAADELFATGAIVANPLPNALLPDISPEDVRQTVGALLRSFGASHEVKIATVAVAFHHWFSVEATK